MTPMQTQISTKTSIGVVALQQKQSRQRLQTKPVYLSFSTARFLMTDTPSDSTLPIYIEELTRKHVKYVVRLCEPTYDSTPLIDAGIKVIDLPFVEDLENDIIIPKQQLKAWIKLIYEVFPKFGLIDVHNPPKDSKEPSEQATKQIPKTQETDTIDHHKPTSHMCQHCEAKNIILQNPTMSLSKKLSDTNSFSSTQPGKSGPTTIASQPVGEKSIELDNLSNSKHRRTSLDEHAISQGSAELPLEHTLSHTTISSSVQTGRFTPSSCGACDSSVSETQQLKMAGDDSKDMNEHIYDTLAPSVIYPTPNTTTIGLPPQPPKKIVVRAYDPKKNSVQIGAPGATYNSPPRTSRVNTRNSVDANNDNLSLTRVNSSRHSGTSDEHGSVYESCHVCASVAAQVGYHPVVTNPNKEKHAKIAANSEHVDEHGNEKITIAVHCISGISRAPLCIAIALLEAGFAVDEAITICRTKKKGSLTPAQVNFLLHYRIRGNPQLRPKKKSKKTPAQCCTIM